jgi:hypothetical protein
MDEKTTPSENKQKPDSAARNPCTEKNAEECSAHEFEATKAAED